MRKLYILLLILILALAACGGDDDDSDNGASSANDTTEQTTDESTDTEEEATTEDTTDADTEEDADATEEATDEDTTDADAEDADATEEATDDDTVDADDEDMEATEEATDDNTEDTDSEEATDEDTEDIESASVDEPVVVSGFQTFEEGCPARFQFQYPTNWTITSSGGRILFDVATDDGVVDAQFEYRGGVAPNQQESTQERFANAASTEQVYTLMYDDVEYPVFRESRTLSGGDVRYYLFILPGNFLIDNIRLVVESTDSGEFPSEDDVIAMISTIVPNRCN